MASKPLQELCVYGFIRLYCDSDIPDALKQICLLFYFIPFEFDLERSNKDLCIDNEELTVNNELNKLDPSRVWRNAFEKTRVSKGQFQQWKLKIITQEGRDRRFIMFGVIDIDEIWKLSPDQFFCVREGGYGYYGWGGAVYDRGIVNVHGNYWRKNDIITMTLDMTQTRDTKKAVLSFKTNNVDENVNLYFNIEKTYCMAIAMSFCESVQLIVDEE